MLYACIILPTFFWTHLVYIPQHSSVFGIERRLTITAKTLLLHFRITFRKLLLLRHIIATETAKTDLVRLLCCLLVRLLVRLLVCGLLCCLLLLWHGITPITT